jgi:hypothetical protein
MALAGQVVAGRLAQADRKAGVAGQEAGVDALGRADQFDGADVFTQRFEDSGYLDAG